VPAVSRWRLGSDHHPVGQTAVRLDGLAALLQRLTGVLRADAIAPWLRKPLQALDSRVPLRTVANGGYAQVSELVSELETFSVS